jgi:hypothetical protein
MPERKFVYQETDGVRRTLVWDDADPTQFGVFTEADLSNLERLNREQGERESARHATTTLARVPLTVWEKAYFENWDERDWNRFLNDPDNAHFRVWPGRL